MQAYHDNPFEVSKDHGDADLNDYYDSVPAPHRLSSGFPASSSTLPSNQGRPGGAFNNIPLSVVSSSTVPPTPYRPLGEHNSPFSADSTDDLTASAPTNRYAGNPPNTRGYGMATAGYSDMGRGSDFNTSGPGNEPRLGAYAPGSTWESRAPKSNRRNWTLIGAIIAIVGIIIIAVTVGVVVSNSHKKNNNLSTSSSGTSVPSNVSTVQGDPNDPSKFTKDSNLRQAFYGMAYTPVGSQLPDCGNSLPAVIQDMQIMSQLTTRVRLYGADCNQSALVLEAIKQTKVNMTVWLGNFVIATDSGASYVRQRDTIKAAIQTYGTDHIGGVTVGNEFMLNYLNDNGATDPNSAVGDAGADLLIVNITDTRSMLTSISANLPVGNSDAGSYFNNKVLAAVDYGMANVHPWFANVTAQVSAGWTADFFTQTDIAQASALTNNPKMYIAETGWPTKSSDAGNESNGASIASEPNLQIFMDTFVCQANTNGTGYFFFEFADEDWKDKQFGGVEGWWGLFYQNRTLKSVTIPNCISP
ncbi:hypothetical protein GALMADRAFT_244493 [Galerina marginata CBS 339.88]|uniref:glucan endo-1,3-beta-D-glucosidase n=1 Tax=Galerina marginata (strain CBS 339.88) TaxID=685588 RepID=A0A067TIR7_GALM3|nr:hypothetical protein GALMADRAFT_244493 [Galerina marginata CBS 339.88]